MNRRRFFSLSLPVLSVPALLAWLVPSASAQNKPAARPFANAGPIPEFIQAFMMPGAQRGNSASAGRLSLQTYAVAHRYDEVCQFYSRAFWGDDFHTLGETGARDNINGDSVFALHQSSSARAGVFFRRTPEHVVSAFVTRGMKEDKTEVTLVYEAT